MSHISTLPITGRCLCGDIKFQITQQPRKMGLCFCRSCQIKSGSDHIAFISVEVDAANIDGPIKWYQAVGDSGKPKRHGFCPNCGTNLFGKPDLWPHILIVYAGALDNPTVYKPAINIWLEDAPAWACVDTNLPKFNKNPG